MANNAIGYVIAGVGAYIIYKMYFANPGVPALATTTQINPGTTPTQNAVTPTVNVTTSTPDPGMLTVAPYTGTYGADWQIPAIQQLDSYVNENGIGQETHTIDEWNWYWLNASGGNIQGPSPESMGVSPRNVGLTYQNYLNLISRWMNGITSLNGVPGLAGIGRLIPANYKMQAPSGRNYRSVGINKPAAIASGWDRAQKRVM